MIVTKRGCFWASENYLGHIGSLFYIFPSLTLLCDKKVSVRLLSQIRYIVHTTKWKSLKKESLYDYTTCFYDNKKVSFSYRESSIQFAHLITQCTNELFWWNNVAIFSIFPKNHIINVMAKYFLNKVHQKHCNITVPGILLETCCSTLEFGPKICKELGRHQ